MKKSLLFLVILITTYTCYSQTPLMLKKSDVQSKAFRVANNLDSVLRLYDDQEVGLATFEDNEIFFINKDKGVKKLYLNSKDLERINKPFDFSDSLQMILIKISDLDFDLQRIDCSRLHEFKSLKHIFYIIETKLDTQEKLAKPNCFTKKVKQFITIEIPT